MRTDVMKQAGVSPPVGMRVLDALRRSALPLSRRDIECRVQVDSEFAVRDALKRLVGKREVRRIDEGDGVPRYTAAGDAGVPPVEIVQPAPGFAEAVEESPGDPVSEDEGDEPVYCAVDQALASLSERLRHQPKPVDNKDLKIRVLEALRDLLDPEIGEVLGDVAEDLRWAE